MTYSKQSSPTEKSLLCFSRKNFSKSSDGRVQNLVVDVEACGCYVGGEVRSPDIPAG